MVMIEKYLIEGFSDVQLIDAQICDQTWWKFNSGGIVQWNNDLFIFLSLARIEE